MDIDKISYLKGIGHSLITRSFKEEWTKEEFLKQYRKRLNWIIRGID